MIKKLLIGILIALILIGFFGIYSAYKYRQSLREARSTAKAPQTSITLLEGWNTQEIADYLEKNSLTKADDFLLAVNSFDTSNYPILASIPKGHDLEGFLFPDTYFILKNLGSASTTDESIIKKALDNFEEKFTPQMESQAKANGSDVYTIVTLASIIEKESSRNDSDRKTIAGIFNNRLAIGMPLQSDATVNFITKKGKASPDIADTQIDSPYNTYKYKGLPPGPICNPSLGSILAALYPEKTDYFYFLTDPKTGRAIFARTYDEHLLNKQKYLK